MTSEPAAERITPPDLEARPGAIDAWRALAELRSNPFSTPEWYFAWLESHPEEEPFLIVWPGGGGELRGVLPLTRTKLGPLSQIGFAGVERSDWLTLACAPEDEEAMAAGAGELLRRLRAEWHLLFLQRLDAGPSGAGRPRWLDALASHARRRRGDVLPFIAFDEGGFPGYLAGRSRNFRSQLGRRRRKLERECGMSFRMTARETELGPDMEAFFAMHDERWRGRGGSQALSADAKDHHRRFAAAALKRGWLRLWIAEADGEPGAAWYGWRIGDRYCYSLSGLRHAYESYGLGTVLLAHTIEQAAEEGAGIYDLMWGDEAYKARFETDRRNVTSWRVARPRHPVGPAFTGAEYLARRARGMPTGIKELIRWTSSPRSVIGVRNVIASDTDAAGPFSTQWGAFGGT